MISENKVWKQLEASSQEFKSTHLRELFKNDSKRAEKFSLKACDIHLDYSKNRLDEKILNLLLDLANEAKLESKIEAMFSGQTINTTEDRAVLHTALRNQSNEPVFENGKDIMPQVKTVLDKMQIFSEKIRQGKWLGFNGKPIKNVVNIGIGGSDLGPAMATLALKAYAKKGINVAFVSNIDPAHFIEVTRELDPGETLFVIASKTFTTDETITNAYAARHWITTAFGSDKAVEKHFVAVSTNKKAVQNFGIDPLNMFRFWDFVGGRYSLASAIGLPLMISIGSGHFLDILAGMHKMDEHFKTTEIKQNLPVILALISMWNIDFLGAQTEAILPYSHYLRLFPLYMQQANMESNGKSVTNSGEKVDFQTGPVVWGHIGTDGQHTFYQLLHQGTILVPCDFIGFVKPIEGIGEHHKKLVINMIAQAEALAFGKSASELESEGVKKELLPHKIFEGNRPSNVIVAPKLTPNTLGQLIALYEHKIFVQGVIWGINSFDQWGVELGKQLAKKIYEELESSNAIDNHDSSTNNLINLFFNK